MGKKFLDKDVYEAAQERLQFIFSEFDNVLVAFSGGKDSGVMLNMAWKYAQKKDLLHKLSVYHLDYEAQYQFTTDYVEQTFKSLPTEVKKYWLCLPIKAQCSTSMFQNFWTPWNEAERNLWVRKIPKYPYIINQKNCEFDYNDWDYVVQDNFTSWFAQKFPNTCVLIGIRADESLNRQSAITSKNKKNQYENRNYITKKNLNYFAYPIYDWTVDDIWIANNKFNFTYNKIYDLFWQSGVSISEMRVASPFNNYAQKALKLYKAIDPNNWGRMISRVNGVNFTGIYGGTTAMGWKSIKKPAHFTWEQYMNFLLDTLPEQTKEIYLKKLKSSKKSWLVGGARDEQTIKELLEENAPVILTGKTNNRGKKEKQVIQFMDYLDDTTVTNFRQVPTYKRMCISIMKNDTTCKYMGFSQTKEEIQRRKEAIEKYVDIL